jgi:hypothetical protein
LEERPRVKHLNFCSWFSPIPTNLGPSCMS